MCDGMEKSTRFLSQSEKSVKNTPLHSRMRKVGNKKQTFESVHDRNQGYVAKTGLVYFYTSKIILTYRKTGFRHDYIS